jgi:hypothetical protein
MDLEKNFACIIGIELGFENKSFWSKRLIFDKIIIENHSLNHGFWKTIFFKHIYNPFLCKQACIGLNKRKKIIIWKLSFSQRNSSRDIREFEIVFK